MAHQTLPALGTCYYPEHWPENMWAKDAAKMVELGLEWVRIGEFSWSKLEPTPGNFNWDWMDLAIDILGSVGLKIVLGTPTATPPRWMLDRHPDMLAHDANNRVRGFGSRRHYCFSHDGYREESRRITKLMAQRYGKNPHIQAWQTDNEYDCHDTAISYSPAAKIAFQHWCAERYQTIEALNKAWGNVFWSMDYNDFAQIGLPNLTVTEANPAHVVAFRRFSSDQVVRFNKVQVDEIRSQCDTQILHNYMGRITAFDHYDVGNDLDIATWDSYPLGFLLDRVENTPERKAAFVRQGDPDFQAFHHDLYRHVGHGRMWVMEQQPGPVNWAPWNPAPLAGMARLWAWEAFAHGAQCVSYFRWRQAPFGQEQHHAGLLRPDNSPAVVYREIQQLSDDIASFGPLPDIDADVALIFDYDSAMIWESQPQGQDFDYFQLVFETYQALNRAGLNIDVISPQTDLSPYKAVFAPGLNSQCKLSTATGPVVLGPRAFAKTPDVQIPVPLPPGLAGLTVSHVESLPPSLRTYIKQGGMFTRWIDRLEVKNPAQTVWETTDGSPALARSGDVYYLAGWPDPQCLETLIKSLDLPNAHLPDGLRLRTFSDGRRIIWNYAAISVEWRGKSYAPASVTFD